MFNVLLTHVLVSGFCSPLHAIDYGTFHGVYWSAGLFNGTTDVSEKTGQPRNNSGTETQTSSVRAQFKPTLRRPEHAHRIGFGAPACTRMHLKPPDLRLCIGRQKVPDNLLVFVPHPPHVHNLHPDIDHLIGELAASQLVLLGPLDVVGGPREKLLILCTPVL